MLFNKKAQVAETITWTVATVAIIFILMISIFVISIGKVGKKEIIMKKTTNFLAVKSLTGYLATEIKGETVFVQLNKDGNFNSESGKLAVNIFDKFYGPGVWLGAVSPGDELKKVYNPYFKLTSTRWKVIPISVGSTLASATYKENYAEDIFQLENQKEVVLITED